MIDFLRANTWCSRDEYIWGLTVAQIRLSTYDFSHVDYHHSSKTKKKKKSDNLKGAQKINGAADLKNMTDLGIPIFKPQK